MLITSKHYTGIDDREPELTSVGFVYSGDDTPIIGSCYLRHDGRAYKWDGTQYSEYGPDCASIWSVKIDEEFRGQGHGSKMMCEVMDMVKDMDYDYVYLICTGGVPARKAYERAGFVWDDEKERGYMYWKKE